MPETINIRDLFLGLQEQMTRRLSTNRKHITHPVTKGDASELCWLETLNSYLPQRYRAEKAFVLDSEGKLSEQIDIVIFDRQYSPFLFKQDNALYVPAESVYAVIEVKQDIDKSTLKYTSRKIASVQYLKRTSAPIPHAGGEYPPKDQFEILSGIVALGCNWNPAFGEAFTNVISLLPPEGRVHLGCSLQNGAFNIAYYEKKEPVIEVCNQEESLIFFFLHLLARLQKMGTVPAMEISEYIKSLKSICRNSV
jgi:hypothetical protein